MRLIREHGYLLFSLLLLIAVTIGIFPYYQYLVDPDATSYLKIAQRYADGDYNKAINGYWSPWSVWLTAALMKAGTPDFSAAIIVNTLGAAGYLWITYSFFTLFGIKTWIKGLLSVTVALFLVYAIFWQSFDDLWECFFLLAALRILLGRGFHAKPMQWVLMGVLGTFAYFAKAYAFPFFILNTLCCTFFITRESDKQVRHVWLKISAISIGTMIICSSPWIYLLYTKYGIVTTGTAGSLNMSWYLVGHPYWNESVVHLLPPVYADSPSYWEDPYILNGYAPHFWSSVRLFFLQGVRIVYNLLKFVQSINELSAFFAATLVFAIAVVWKKASRDFEHRKLFVLSLSFLVFPLGYILVNFQARYLWYMVPLSMTLGVLAIQKTCSAEGKKRILKHALVVAFAISFLVTPILGLKSMYRGGQREYKMSQWMKQRGIRGTFTTNIPYSSKTQDIVRLAWFSGNPYYNMPLPVSQRELLKEMRRYNIKYYFHFKETDDESCHFTDESGRPFPEITGGRLKGLNIYLVTPE